ncbi:MAG: hypothetical protein EU530_02810 [Promethearchaeota archaeon]|nr:MAG: hypothetical protein EU530_02810 [Candidatus Lokiarchaeota archaeon]
MFDERPTQWIQLFGSLLSAFFAFVIFGFLAKRKRLKKNEDTKTLLYMEIVAFCLAFAALIDGGFLFTNELFGFEYVIIEAYEFVNLGSYLSFSLNALSNYFLLAFAKEIYGEQIKKGLYITLSIIQLAVIPILLFVYFLGPFLFAEILADVSLIPFVAHIICSIVIYIVYSVNAFKLRKVMGRASDQDPIIHKALGDLGVTGIFMLLAVLSFITHEVFLMTEIALLKNEAISIAFGWIFGAIAAFFMYSGYVSPELMKRRT